MNICSFLIITFLCIAGSTSASFEAFEDNDNIYYEVKAYCKSPAEYKNSKGGEKYGPIGGWNVSAVTSMFELFFDFRNCNPDISKWDVSEVKDFEFMFRGAASFNQDLSKWNVANGLYFDSMFKGATAFNQDLSEWNVANGLHFMGMFHGAAAFNQYLSKWNVANGLRFDSMFKGATAFNQDLSEWNVANGQNFGGMFSGAAAFNQDLSEWNVGNGQNFIYMFKDSGLGLGLGFCIGDWDFTSMENSVGKPSIFFSMLPEMNYDAASNEEWEQQLKNFVALVSCTKKKSR